MFFGENKCYIAVWWFEFPHYIFLLKYVTVQAALICFIITIHVYVKKLSTVIFFASVTFSVSCCMNNLIRNLFQSIYIPSWSNILSLISPTCAWVLNKYHTIHINVKRCINTCDLTKHRKGVGQNFQPRRVSLRLTKHHQRCNIEFYGHLLWTTLKLLFCVILSS